MTTTSSQKPGCLGALLRIFSRSEAARPPTSPTAEVELDEQELAAEALPYRVRDDFLSPAEISLYHILSAVTRDAAIVCPKVGFKDIFFTATAENRQGHFNRIARKHVDFLVCHPKTMRPLVGVELDDRSHDAAHRQERDSFVDRAFKDAELPLVRIVARRSYNLAEVHALIAPYIAEERQGAAEPQQPEKASMHATVPGAPPLCPKCGIPMILRTASRGKQLGNQFYGCQNYPQCRETQQLVD